jgi:hypothetical protein
VTRRRALSLAELIMVLATMGAMLALTLVSLRSGSRSLGSRGLAEVLADELRSARALALSSRQPVGVLFPGGAGQSVRGYFIARGRQLGQIVKGCNLGSEYGQASLFIGDWPSSLGVFSNTDLHLGLGDDLLSLTGWRPTNHGTDRSLVFLPSGRVRGLDFPHTGGYYTLVAAQGVRVGGSTLQGAADPYSVVVSSQGAVQVVKGVFAASTNLEDPNAPRALPAPLPALPAPGSSPPEIKGVRVYPDNNSAVHGNEYSISDIVIDLYPDKPGSPDNSRDFSTITMRVYATDPDGGPLRYSWSEENGKGRFSAREGTMEWLADDKVWASWCDWTPPVSAQNTDAFTFDCKVSDPEGNYKTTSAKGINIRVKPRTSGKIAFDKFTPISAFSGSDAIWVMNIDGTAIRELSNQGEVNEGAPDWSPSGDWLAFHSLDSSWKSDVIIASGDGKSRINLTSNSNDDIYPRWSPRGDQIANYSDGNGNGIYGVVVREAQSGGDRHSIAGDCTWWAFNPPSFSPNGDYIAYLNDSGAGPTHVHIKPVTAQQSDPPLVRLDAAEGYDVQYVKWNPVHPDRMLAVTWLGKLLLLRVDPSLPASDPVNQGIRVDLSTKGLGFNAAWDAEWSPNGEDLAVSGENPNHDLFLIQNAWDDARVATRLTSGRETMAPVFSQDGIWLVCQAWQTKQQGVPASQSAYKLFRRLATPGPSEPDNAQLKLLTEDSADVSGHSVSR